MEDYKKVSDHITNLRQELYQLKPLDNEAWLEWVDGIKSAYIAVKLLADPPLDLALRNLVALAMVKWLKIHTVPKPIRELADFAHYKGYWR